MGIFLSFRVAPHRISEAQWEDVYQEALQIVDHCDLMDRIVTERSGKRFAFARKTAERDLWERGPGIPQPPGVYELWGDKTQGKPGHIPLLAIACLFADRFPEAVMVGGDITAGQCRAAVRLANQYLERPIQTPVTCRAEALARYKPEDHASRTTLRNYLLLGLEFSDPLNMLVTDPEGSCLSLEQMLKEIFSRRVHVPFSEKGCIDPIGELDAAADGDSEAPHGINAMFGRLFFSMAAGRNQNLPVYVPPAARFIHR